MNDERTPASLNWRLLVWWVLACGVGWVVSGLAAGVTDSVAGWAVLGAVYGAMTGCVLVWLLRRAGAR